jgi:hypothetical protein
LKFSHRVSSQLNTLSLSLCFTHTVLLEDLSLIISHYMLQKLCSSSGTAEKSTKLFCLIIATATELFWVCFGTDLLLVKIGHGNVSVHVHEFIFCPAVIYHNLSQVFHLDQFWKLWITRYFINCNIFPYCLISCNSSPSLCFVCELNVIFCSSIFLQF